MVQAVRDVMPKSRTVRSNRAFESGRAEAQRALGLRPLRRAAQRER